MNGVAEALLEELLAQSKTQTQLLQQLARNFTGGGGGGGSGGGGAGGGAGGVIASFNALGLATRALAGLFNFLSGFVSKLFNALGAIVGSAVNVIKAFDQLGEKALTAGVRLSDFFKALESVPVIGRIAEFFTGLIQGQERLLDSYRALSRSGVTFSGNLIDLVQAAGKTILTLDQLQKVLADNRQAFAILGAGNVQQGFNKFIDAQNKLMGPGSEYSERILALGVTADQAAGFLGSLTRSQGIMSRQNQVSAEQLAKQTSDYIIQLDALTRLTGIQKEQIDETVRKAREDQLFQLFMDTLGPQQRRFADEAIRIAGIGGPELVREVQARLRGLDAPVTELGKNLTALSGGAILEGQNLRDAMYSATKSTDVAAVALKFIEPVIKNVGDAVGSFGSEAQAAIPLFQSIPPVFLSLFRALSTGKTLQEAYNDVLEQGKETFGRSAAQQAIINNNVQAFGLRIAEISNTIRAIFAPILLAVSGNLLSFGNELVDIAESLVASDGFKEAVGNVTAWFKKTFQDVSEAFKKGDIAGGVSAFLTQLGSGIKGIWQYVKEPIMNWYETYLSPWFDILMIKFDLMVDDIVDKLWGGLNEEKSAIRKQEADQKILDIKISQLESMVAAGRQLSFEDQARLDIMKSERDSLRREMEIRSQRALNIATASTAAAAGIVPFGMLSTMPSATGNAATAIDTTGIGPVTRAPPPFTQPQAPLSFADRQIETDPNKINFDIYNLNLNMLDQMRQFNQNAEIQNRLLRSLNGNLYTP